MLLHFLFLVNNLSSHLFELTAFHFCHLYIYCVLPGLYYVKYILILTLFVCVYFRSCVRIPTSFLFQYLYRLNPLFILDCEFQRN